MQTELAVPLKPAAKPRDTLDPNKISGAYILALFLCQPMKQFQVTVDTLGKRTKVYNHFGRYFTVPQKGESPYQISALPFESMYWLKVGAKYGRGIFKAMVK